MFGMNKNDRMVGGGRDFWRSSCQTTHARQFYLEQVAQDYIQMGFKYLQRRTFLNVSGQPVPLFCHPHSKEVIPHIQMDLSVFQFCPLSLVLSLGAM